MNKNSIILIIQARMQSTRFPNKAIADLCGAPLIERVFQRIKRVKGIDGIILATTKRKDDDILSKIGNDKSNPAPLLPFRLVLFALSNEVL